MLILNQTHNSTVQASTYQGRTRSASLGLGEQKHELDLFAVSDFARAGIQSIVDDQVTKRFAAKELQTWNLLTRTDKFYHYKSLRLAAIWLTGAFFRYFILFPFRAIITIVGVLFLIAITGLIGLIFPEGKCSNRCLCFIDLNFITFFVVDVVQVQSRSGSTTRSVSCAFACARVVFPA